MGGPRGGEVWESYRGIDFDLSDIISDLTSINELRHPVTIEIPNLPSRVVNTKSYDDRYDELWHENTSYGHL